MHIEILIENLSRMQKLSQRLVQAVAQLEAVFPLDPLTFNPEELASETSLFFDGFRARFADLQDMLGKTMFKSITQIDQDESPGQELTTRERITLMEKRGLIDVEKWRQIREVRNAFAHEYPDAHAEKATILNLAWELSPELLNVSNAIMDYCHKKYSIPV
jgi:hypothetical protein